MRTASKANQFDLRVQPGVRIGVVISDDLTMLFAPVPMLIEAGSTTSDKPNAIIIAGGNTDRVADAAGAGIGNGNTNQEIGTETLTPNRAEALEQDLKINPPQAFDLARALRVFSSRVQYVELEVANYRLSSRQVQLPPELLNITDDELRKRISSRIRTPAGELGKFKIKVETSNGTMVLEIDERWLTTERKRIEDLYTFTIPRFGRVILSTQRKCFDEEIARYRETVLAYQQAVVGELDKVKSNFVKKLVEEYLPKWQQNPPENLTRYLPKPTQEDIELYLREVAQRLFADAIDFAPPQVRVIYKNIAPESVRDSAFLEPLQSIMVRRGVPNRIIATLFASGDAAPTPGELTAL